MPEGPSILLMKESLQCFCGQKVLQANGNAKIDMALLEGKTLLEIKTFGKQTYLVFDTINVRIHLLMFGSYSIDEQTKPDAQLRLALHFKTGGMYFYTCSVKLLDNVYLSTIDWEADVLSDEWNPEKANQKLIAKPQMMVCDALMNQDIFSGVGNIIKNEVLFWIGVHPESLIGHLPPEKLDKLIFEARNYSFDFLKWKKEYTLRKHWLAHTKKICARDGDKIVKEYLGKTQRRTFFCNTCQVLYK